MACARLRALCLLGIAVMAHAQLPMFNTDSYVTALTPDNFDTVVGRDQAVLVMFYAPWCVHCKRLAPVYELVGHAFQRERKVLIAKLDAIEHAAIKEHFDVAGFPSIKFFPANQELLAPIDFTGNRTAQALVEFANEHAGASGYLKGPAAQAGRIPSLTAEAKERAKLRWQKHFTEQQASPAATGAAPSQSSGGASVAGVKATAMPVPDGNTVTEEGDKAKLEARREELRRKLEVENKPKKKTKRTKRTSDEL